MFGLHKRSNFGVRYALGAVLVLAIATTSWAKSAQSTDDTPAKSVAATTQSIADTTTATGWLVPKDPEKVKVELKQYSGKLEVIEAHPEGPVKAGDVLVRFDTEDIDKAIEKAERATALSKIKMQEAEINLAHARATAERAFKWAERNHRIYKDNYDRYLEVERAIREESEDLSFQWDIDSLNDQREEFEQLEKMYKDDDLTEETEEIVLRRTARRLARSERYFEFSKIRHEHWKKTYMDRELERRRYNLENAEATMEKKRKTWRFAVERQEIGIVDVREGHEETLKKLTELRKDLDLLVVKAPVSGFAVPAAFSGTKWSGRADRADRYRPEDKLKAGSVIYTILPTWTVRVRCTVKDEDIDGIEVGSPAYVERTSTCKGEGMIEGKITYVSPLPSDGKYVVWVKLPQEIDGLRPGQKTKVELPTSEMREAICVPKDCLREKKKKHFVYPIGNDKGVEVEVGARMNGLVEIESGLEEGQELQAKPPKEAKKEKKKKDDTKEEKDEKKEEKQDSEKKDDKKKDDAGDESADDKKKSK